MKKFRITCFIDRDERRKTEYRALGRDRGEITVFLSKNIFGNKYKIIKNKVVINE